MKLPLIIRLLPALALWIAVCGCSAWKQPEPEKRETKNPFKFGVSRMKPDSVALEMAVAQFDNLQTEDLEKLWSQLDQQVLPVSVRKLLDQNGLRVAVLPSNVSALMQKLLEPVPIDLDSLDELQLHLYEKGRLKPESRLVTSVHRQISKAESFMLNVSSLWPEFSWVLHQGQQATPGAGQSVQGVFELMTYPQGDGSVRIQIAPKIFHGVQKTSIGVANGEYVFQAGRDSVPLSALEFELDLLPGQSILIGPTKDVSDLGRLFFSSEKREISPAALTGFTVDQAVDLNELDQLAIEWDDESEFGQNGKDEAAAHVDDGATGDQFTEAERKLTHRALLIRVVQTQKDDLFSQPR